MEYISILFGKREGNDGMSYASIGIIALIIHFIINYNIFKKDPEKEELPVLKAYRLFLTGVSVYYITDALWGILYDRRLITLTYADTVIYFVAMAATVLLWARYVAVYLQTETVIKKLLIYIVRLFFVFEIAVIAVNFFKPILFSFDANGGYTAGKARHLTLFIQILIYFLTFLYTMIIILRTKGRARSRYAAISFFSLTMSIMIAIQGFNPLLPIYSAGYLIGTCLLHTFVLGDENEEKQKELEELLERAKEQSMALGSAWRMAYTDPLTGVKNKQAYMDYESGLDDRIKAGKVAEFGILVCDLNGLKNINDTLGHEAGDCYIKDACEFICRRFKHSPVYRIGGDEFAVILEGEDYRRRNAVLSEFNRHVEDNLENGGPIIAAGMSEYIPEKDDCVMRVFKRADNDMYERKDILKKMS